jgi:hypothetical protein
MYRCENQKKVRGLRPFLVAEFTGRFPLGARRRCKRSTGRAPIGMFPDPTCARDCLQRFGRILIDFFADTTGACFRFLLLCCASDDALKRCRLEEAFLWWRALSG